MTSPILVGLALREDDASPLALARSLARIGHAPLALATVFPFDVVAPAGTVEYARATQEQARERIDAIAAPLRTEHEVTTHVLEGNRAGALQALAEELGAAAIVVGSSHRGGVGRILAGDVAAGLLHDAPTTVAVAPRGHAARELRRIGVGYTATDEGIQAAAAGLGLARRTGATVALISVVEPAVYTDAHVVPGWAPPVAIDVESVERRMRADAQQLIADLGEGVECTVHVPYGTVLHTLAEASGSLDLLVCGSRGYGALHSALAGGVSRGLAHMAACPLLLVPRRAGAHAAALWQGDAEGSAVNH